MNDSAVVDSVLLAHDKGMVRVQGPSVLPLSVSRLAAPATWSMLLLLCLYLVAMATEDAGFIDGLNVAGPLILFIVCSGTSAWLAYNNSLLIWSPLPWFLLTSALYYGFGPLLYSFGNPGTVAWADVWYEVNATSLLKTNLLNAVSILAVLAAIHATASWTDKTRRTKPTRLSLAQTEKILWILLAIGLSLKYLIILPYEFGQFEFTLFGMIQSCKNFTTLAVFLLAYLVAAGQSKYRFLFISFCILEFSVSVLTMAKLELMMTIMMIFLGFYFARRNITLLIVGAFLCLIVYIPANTLLTAARQDLVDRDERGLLARFDCISERISSGDFQTDPEEADTQYWWARLNYANVQSFVMDAYDAGNPGSTYVYVIYAFIPRALWPDKPVIEFGRDLNELLFHNRNSHAGVGVFGEAYWNGGWVWVVLTGIFLGCEFSLFTRLAFQYLGGLDFRILPCAFIGIYMGLRSDDSFVTIYVGQAVICAGYFVLVKWLIPDVNAEEVGFAER